MRKYVIAVLFSLAFAFGTLAQAPAAKPPLKSHALAKVASVAVAPVVHPKRTLKQTLGVVVFAVENVVDGARLGLETADKAFDAISIQGKIPVLDEIYAVVSVGAKDAAKLDVWLERQEKGLFGTSN
jgi:hypothetical protein